MLNKSCLHIAVKHQVGLIISESINRSCKRHLFRTEEFVYPGLYQEREVQIITEDLLTHTSLGVKGREIVKRVEVAREPQIRGACVSIGIFRCVTSIGYLD